MRFRKDICVKKALTAVHTQTFSKTIMKLFNTLMAEAVVMKELKNHHPKTCNGTTYLKSLSCKWKIMTKILITENFIFL